MPEPAHPQIFSCIVEGHGEIDALPELIRRVASLVQPEQVVLCPSPLRVKRDRFLKFDQEEDFARYLGLAAGKMRRAGDSVFILLDSEGECPVTYAQDILTNARQVIGHVPIHVILAHHMYENWFVAAGNSISGQQGLQAALTAPQDPENRSGKGWIKSNLESGRKYTEPIDQPILTKHFDLEEAMACRSFRKCRREIESALVSGNYDDPNQETH